MDINETPATFDETLASNPKAVAAAQTIVAPETVSDSSNSKPAAKGGKARRAKKEASQKTIAIEEEVTVQTVSKLLGLPVRENGLILPCGASGRWTAGAQ